MDESPILSITVDKSNHDLVLAVDGEMDAATADALRNALEAVDPTDSIQVVVDLEHVSFIDSKGLLALLEARDRLAQRHIRLLIRNPQTQARRLFDLALNGEQFEEARGA
jgi:anti-sigma B factor antagonist